VRLWWLAGQPSEDDRVVAFATHTGSARVAAATRAGRLLVWDMAAAASPAAAPEGDHDAGAHEDSLLGVWGQCTAAVPLAPAPAPRMVLEATSVAWAPDGMTIAVGVATTAVPGSAGVLAPADAVRLYTIDGAPLSALDGDGQSGSPSPNAGCVMRGRTRTLSLATRALTRSGYAVLRRCMQAAGAPGRRRADRGQRQRRDSIRHRCRRGLGPCA
jgi:hypothetical protein